MDISYLRITSIGGYMQRIAARSLRNILITIKLDNVNFSASDIRILPRQNATVCAKTTNEPVTR
jgi:hypothetical protein